MKTKPKTRTETDNRLAYAWYVKYPLDAYALGPYRYKNMVPASKAVEDAEASFGEPPSEVWPDGPTQETDEYEYEVLELDDTEE